MSPNGSRAHHWFLLLNTFYSISPMEKQIFKLSGERKALPGGEPRPGFFTADGGDDDTEVYPWIDFPFG